MSAELGYQKMGSFSTLLLMKNSISGFRRSISRHKNGKNSGRKKESKRLAKNTKMLKLPIKLLRLLRLPLKRSKHSLQASEFR